MSHHHDPSSAGEIDRGICPLCGKPNHCAYARGESSCWCETAIVPMDVVMRVPKELRGKACVCRECAGLAGESEN